MSYTEKRPDGTVKITGRNLTFESIFDAIYPVGALFITEADDDPNDLFTGTWVQYAEGTTLVGVDSGDSDFDTAGETGGSKTQTLTVGNLPPHAHSMNHSHDITRKTGVGSSSGMARGNGSSEPDATTSSHSGDTGSGSSNGLNSDSFSLMNPYTAVYIWKRTA